MVWVNPIVAAPNAMAPRSNDKFHRNRKATQSLKATKPNAMAISPRRRFLASKTEPTLMAQLGGNFVWNGEAERLLHRHDAHNPVERTSDHEREAHQHERDEPHLPDGELRPDPLRVSERQ